MIIYILISNGYGSYSTLGIFSSMENAKKEKKRLKKIGKEYEKQNWYHEFDYNLEIWTYELDAQQRVYSDGKGGYL